jgi:hypothetical protein
MPTTARRWTRLTRILCAAGVATGIAVTPVATTPALAGAGTEDCIFIRPFFGAPTTPVTVNGCGFWANEGIEISLSDTTRARSRTNGKGEFSTKFAIPVDERAGARAVTAVGLSSHLFARTTFLVQNHP